ncbi:hypothetical protein BGZ94_005900 [Podila epigama]|nr:hypothetical protein BGZ94_005900 [Podila epigama]
MGDTANGVFDPTKKRKSQSSPLLGGADSPTLSSEPKRPKTTEFTEGKKNVEVTQIEFNDVLSAIFKVIQGFDKHSALSATVETIVDGVSVQLTGKYVKEQLQESKYSSVLSFKNDLSKIFHRAITVNSNPEVQDHIRKLLQLSSSLIADKSHYTIRSHGKKVRSQEENQVTLPERDHEKIALFQRTNEGFLFSSTAHGKDDMIEQDIPKTVVVPVASAPNPPLLNDVNSRPHPARSAAPAKKAATGVDYRPLGAFTSFAPFIDSSNAEMNAEDTATAYTALLDRYLQKTQSSAGSDEQKKAKSQLESVLLIAQQNQASREGTTTELSEDDLAFLSEDGLDVRKLITLNGNKRSEGTGKDPESVLEMLQKNAMLLFELQQLQEDRFASNNQTISIREQKLAEALRLSLANLADKMKPSDLVSAEAVEKTMTKIPYKEAAFGGALPPTKPFAFPTNAARNGIPATATAYPTHNPTANKKIANAPFIPAVVLSHHLNMTGGYPTVPQPTNYSYNAPQQVGHRKTYSRPQRTEVA